MKTISVGRLRQNPTEMIHQVRVGAEYVLTDRGVPTARIVPYVAERWVNASDARALLSVPAGSAWVDELHQSRLAQTPRDPWVQR